MRDDLYAQGQDPVGGFRFDARVVEVFDDMIRRSVPGYLSTIGILPQLIERFVEPGGLIYDLGCSTGAGTLAMATALEGREGRLVAVDNSEAMIERCRSRLAQVGLEERVELRCEDILETELEEASLFVLNFTLQFVECAEREDFLADLADACRPGGLLLLSEKLAFEDEQEQLRLQQLHEGFKRSQGYSELEIARKRTALEEVLVPETREVHLERLARVGFSRVLPWFQCLNFASFLAFRDA